MPYLDSEGLAYLVEKLKEQSTPGTSTYPGIRVVQLKASEWLDGNLQTEIVFGVKPSQKNQTIVPEPIYSQKDLYDQCKIEIQSKTENQITFHADTLPTEDITLYLTIFDLNPDQEETVLDHIQVTQMPDKIRYVKDTPFDPTGLKVKAFFSNDLSFDVGLESLTFNPNTSIPFGTTAITVAFNWGGIEKTASIPITVIKAYVYGVRWVGDGNTGYNLERTDDAVGFSNPIPYKPGVNPLSCTSPFDDIYPWSEMKVENRKYGQFVKVPKFYYKLNSYQTSGFELRISSEPLDGYHISPLHMARTITTNSVLKHPLKEIPYAYVSAGFVDFLSHDDIEIVNGVYATPHLMPANTQSIRQVMNGLFSVNENLLEDDIYSYDMTADFTLRMLVLVEYAALNISNRIGHGLLEQYSNYTYLVDHTTKRLYQVSKEIPYHTGVMQVECSAESGNWFNVHHVVYRGIRNLWGCLNYVSGAYWNGPSNAIMGAGDKNYGTIYPGLQPSILSDTAFGSNKLAEVSFSTSSSFTTIDGVAVRDWSDGYPFMFPAKTNSQSSTSHGYCYYGGSYRADGTSYTSGYIATGLCRSFLNQSVTIEYYQQLMSMTYLNYNLDNACYWPRIMELPQTENEERNDDMNKYSPPVT